jgi:hypothetical protein
MAWETLRELKAKNKLKSLTQHVSDSVDDAYQAADDAFEEHGGEGGIPCYDHFYEAASVDVPGYKVELAKSDRVSLFHCCLFFIVEPIFFSLKEQIIHALTFFPSRHELEIFTSSSSSS